MYPLHTGSVLLDIAHAQRNELITSAANRRRAAMASRPASTTKTRPLKRPWWWGLARSHRAA